MSTEQRILQITQLVAAAIIAVSCYLVLRISFAALLFAVVVCISTEVDSGGVSYSPAACIAGDCPVSSAGLQPSGQHGGHYRRGKAIFGPPDTAARMAQTVTHGR
jgi:hypothetical protein